MSSYNNTKLGSILFTFIISTSLLSSGCMQRGKRVVTYDWKYEKIENPAVDYPITDFDKAETLCKNKVKSKIRYIHDDDYKTASYVSYMRRCMKTEGWQLKGDPVRVKYVEE